MEKKRSVGIWIYGIVFLIFGLASLIPSLSSIIDKNHIDAYYAKKNAYLIFFGLSMLLVIFFILLGIFTLSCKFRLLILIFLLIPFLYNSVYLFDMVKAMINDIYYHGHLTDFKIISNLVISIIFFLFFTSAIYYFTRPKVKERFR